MTDSAGVPGSRFLSDPNRISYLDNHAHLAVHYPVAGSLHTDFEGAVAVALSTMNSLSVEKSLLMPPPQVPEMRLYDYEELAQVAKKIPERFAFLGGGGSLNPMIQESVRSGKLTPDLEQKFEQKAIEILGHGAVGFGELTAEHLSFASWHPYEAAPPDHPLFLLLADIAARYDVPIDLHMEAVPQDMPLPPGFGSPPNPRTLRQNLAGFERLLSHNRQARIVWAHAGWDNTGFRTVALMRRLLEKHPNLYMSLKIVTTMIDFHNGFGSNRPLSETGAIRPEWVDLIRSFPDRFIIGSDQFHASPRNPRRWPPSSQGPRAFLDQLPADLARKVAYENPVRIYKLK